jgi:indole-3-glycerol phosphate synthase
MTILDRILATKRREVEAARRTVPLAQVREAAVKQPQPRDFFGAVTAKTSTGVNLIAEIKKQSPSAGLLVPRFDVAEIARTYHRNGAAAISVLTDETYFGGELGHIAEAKSAVPLPVLRKDFLVDEYQVYESRAAGADAILLIAEALEVERIAESVGLAVGLGMAPMVEVHSVEQLGLVIARLGLPAIAICLE